MRRGLSHKEKAPGRQAPSGRPRDKDGVQVAGVLSAVASGLLSDVTVRASASFLSARVRVRQSPSPALTVPSENTDPVALLSQAVFPPFVKFGFVSVSYRSLLY